MREALCRAGQPAAGGALVVGVSGGADSLCLLHALHALAPELGYRLHVAHLDHGLRVTAAEDAAWVAALCARWGLPCTVGHAQVRALAEAEGRSLEEAARLARYRFLAHVALTVGARVVAVGHTADDQAETLLLHLLRGAGLAGLVGMAPAASWPLPGEAVDAGLTLLRPLLAVSRQDTVGYCAALGLTPRQDETNADPAYMRNRLRLELMPLLRELNPQVVAALGRTATILRDEDVLLQQVEDEAWARIAVVADDGAWVKLARQPFAALPVALRRRLLRRAARTLGLVQDLSWEHLAASLAVADGGRTGAQATWPRGLRLRVDYGWLWIERPEARPAILDWPALDAPVALAIPGEAALADGWRVAARLLVRAALPADWAQAVQPRLAYLDAAKLGASILLRARQPGDWLVPLGMTGRQKVSDLLINTRVPAACRERLPLLTVQGQVAWVLGVRTDQRYAVTEQTREVCALRVWREGEQDHG